MKRFISEKGGTGSGIVIVILAVIIVILGIKVLTQDKAKTEPAQQSAAKVEGTAAVPELPKKLQLLTDAQITGMLSKPAEEIDFKLLSESIANSPSCDSFQSAYMKVFSEKLHSLYVQEKHYEIYQLFQAAEALSWDSLNVDWKNFKDSLRQEYHDAVRFGKDRSVRLELRKTMQKVNPDEPMIEEDLALEKIQNFVLRRKYDDAQAVINAVESYPLRNRLQSHLDRLKRSNEQNDRLRERENAADRLRQEQLNRNNREQADGRPLRDQRPGSVDSSGRKLSSFGQVMTNFRRGNKEAIVKLYQEGFDFHRVVKFRKVPKTVFLYMLEQVKNGSGSMRTAQLECILALLDNGFKPNQEELQLIQTIDGLAGNE